MVGQKQFLQCDQVVRLGHDQAEFLQQRFEELLGRLLAMETPLIVKRLVAATELHGGGVIALRLANPRPSRPFHRGPYPWSRSRCGTTRPRRAARPGSRASARLGPWETGRPRPRES